METGELWFYVFLDTVWASTRTSLSDFLFEAFLIHHKGFLSWSQMCQRELRYVSHYVVWITRFYVQLWNVNSVKTGHRVCETLFLLVLFAVTNCTSHEWIWYNSVHVWNLFLAGQSWQKTTPNLALLTLGDHFLAVTALLMYQTLFYMEFPMMTNWGKALCLTWPMQSRWIKLL